MDHTAIIKLAGKTNAASNLTLHNGHHNFKTDEQEVYAVLICDALYTRHSLPNCIVEILHNCQTKLYGMGIGSDVKHIFSDFELIATNILDYQRAWPKHIVLCGGYVGRGTRLFADKINNDNVPKKQKNRN